MTREQMIDEAVLTHGREWAALAQYDFVKMLKDWADFYSWGCALHDSAIRREFRRIAEREAQ